MSTSKQLIRILIVRHGVTSWNKEGRYQGQTDIPLSDEGIAQAEAVGRRLSREPVFRVYSSDLTRARMTAEIIATHHGIQVITDRRLREINFGEWEGHTYEEVSQKWPELWDQWVNGPVSLRTLRSVGGESMSDLLSRVREALRDIYRDFQDCHLAGEASSVDYTAAGDTAQRCCVIVCHGGVIRALIALSSGSLDTSWPNPVRQSSVTTGRLGCDGLAIEAWDDVTHLT